MWYCMFEAQLFLQLQFEPDTEHTLSTVLYASCSTDSYRLLSTSMDNKGVTHTHQKVLDQADYALHYLLPLVGLPIRLVSKSAGLRTVDIPPFPL
jgi:hypothetical protein